MDSPLSAHTPLKQGPQLILLSDSSVERLAEALVSLANGTGGHVVVGIEPDTGEPVGAVPDAVEQDLRAAQSQTSPYIAVEWHEDESEHGTLVVLRVPEGRQLHSLLDGRILIRAGTINRVLLGPELQSLMSSRPQVVGELQPVYGATLDDLSDERVKEFIDLHRQKNHWQGVMATSRFLERQGALDETGCPTLCGLLLFGQDPQAFLPYTRVVFVNFKNSVRASEEDLRYSRREEITGNLPELITTTYNVIRQEMARASVVQGLSRIDRTEYPLSVVREALVNAVAHRDYAHTGRSVEIHMFEDSLEVISPGGLPEHMTLDNILDEHYSRNPRIVNGLYHWGFIEELGLGVDLIYNELAQNGHPPPEFSATPNRFSVKMYNARDTSVPAEHWQTFMNQRQMAAVSHIQSTGSISNREYQTLCPHVSAETLRLDLANLVERGVLLRIGEKRGTRYILKR